MFLRAGENVLDENKRVRFVDVVVADSSTGLRILTETHVWDEERPDETVVGIADNVKRARLRVGEGISAIVAVPSFVNDDLTRDYDTMQEAYAELIRRSVGSIAGVLVVELAEARAFAQEESLSGVQFAGRPLLPLYVLGRYRNEGIGEDRKVAIAMEVRQGEKRLTEERLEGIGQRDGSQGSITAKEGLPPGSITLAAWGPGRVCLIGSFGRSWIANAFFNGKAIEPLDVFHQARSLSGGNDDSELAFSPIFVVTLPDPTERGRPTVLVGRRIEGQQSSYPLIVNPSGRSVAVLRERFSPRLTGEKMTIHEHSLYWVSNLGDVLPSVHLAVWSNNSDGTRRKFGEM